MLKTIGLILLALAIVAGAAYWYYSGQLLTGNTGMVVPGRPPKDVGPPPAKIQRPTDAELDAYFQPLRWRVGGG